MDAFDSQNIANIVNAFASAKVRNVELFQAPDKGSVFYIRGLEDVEQTEGLFDVMEAEDDPEPEEKEENVD